VVGDIDTSRTLVTETSDEVYLGEV
jgi:hypothetical protein